MEKRISCRIRPEDIPMTVGQACRAKLSLTPRQISSAKFRADGICRNGRKVRVDQLLEPGDLVEVLLEKAGGEAGGRTGERVRPVPGKLDILYEDEDILALNKPAGMPVHPGRGHFDDTLANAVQDHYCRGEGEQTIRVIGRLDKDTSGVVLFAQHAAAAARLSGAAGKGYQKTYLAIVGGRFPAGAQTRHIFLPLRKKMEELNRMEVSPEGQEAYTILRIIDVGREGRCSLAEALPVTGRTHQIRVHLAALGHPLAGDPFYGGMGGIDETEETGRKVPVMSRTALHCCRVCLRQPFTGKELTITAPMPEDMERFWRYQKNG